MSNISSQRMVATSLVDPDATSSPSLYARIRQVLQPKLPISDAHASHPNEDGSHTGQGSANPGEVGPVCLFLVIMFHVMVAYFP